VAADSPRIAELRRRVEADPASIAFAQLAEEYRRSGNFDEAVQWCRSGLVRFPGYVSARVTLGRALIELGQLDEARRELEIVLESAPDNLAAKRSIASIDERRQTQPATPVKAAASAAPTVEPEQPSVKAPASAAAPSNFDTMLTSLGAGDLSTPPIIDALLKEERSKPVSPEVVLPALPAEAPKDDSFAALERSLREFDRSAHRTEPSIGAMEQMVVDELERWLSAIDRDRVLPSRNPRSV
jgi:tetratricopeptide (TPR) repeat protein